MYAFHDDGTHHADIRRWASLSARELRGEVVQIALYNNILPEEILGSPLVSPGSPPGKNFLAMMLHLKEVRPQTLDVSTMDDVVHLVSLYVELESVYSSPQNSVKLAPPPSSSVVTRVDVATQTETRKVDMPSLLSTNWSTACPTCFRMPIDAKDCVSLPRCGHLVCNTCHLEMVMRGIFVCPICESNRNNSRTVLMPATNTPVVLIKGCMSEGCPCPYRQKQFGPIKKITAPKCTHCGHDIWMHRK